MSLLVIKRMSVSIFCRKVLPIWDYKVDILLLRHPVVRMHTWLFFLQKILANLELFLILNNSIGTFENT